MKPTLSHELALDALVMAAWRRKPNGKVMLNSDQGSQDNAVAELFFSSLKKELIIKRIYKTRDLVRVDIFDYIEVFHNQVRRHSHLEGFSPESFEQTSL